MRQVQNPDVQCENICGKPVFTFDNHHEALLPWAECASALDCAPRLLTLDYHSDTRSAFLSFSTKNIAWVKSNGGWQERAAGEVAKINFRAVETVRDAVANLQHDEHISAGVQSGIIDITFAIVGGPITNEYRSNEQNSAEVQWRERDTPGEPKPLALPPYSYSIPKERIIELPRQKVSSDEPVRSKGYADQALESDFLLRHLELIEAITKSADVPGLFEAPFILDFDLDYFNTRRSIQPTDHDVLHELIRRAEIITIAREPKCVSNLQKSGENLTSDWLEAELKQHIKNALSLAL
ncbi:UPF0489 family protein [Pseudomonas cichorii]|nr:UPF0489 family protein [Pseudomonas cichorii]MBX8557003.1 UPF0489 family protein [Pseudomonas cichorii]MBX8592722.1 UPF0489 family protein [Pseudomonas cichorii]